MIVIRRQEEGVGIDRDKLLFRHHLSITYAECSAPVRNACERTGLVKTAADAAVGTHERDEDDALALLRRNLLHLCLNLRQFFIHHGLQPYAALLFTRCCREQRDRLTDFCEILCPFADNHLHPRLAQRRYDGEIPPVRNNDEIGLQCHDLLQCWISNAVRNHFYEFCHIGAHRIVKESIHRRHALRLDQSQHHLIRTHRQCDDAFGWRGKCGDRSLNICHLIRDRLRRTGSRRTARREQKAQHTEEECHVFSRQDSLLPFRHKHEL